ncbi:MAG: fluoride efflux transporter CrcB [Gammaproteobacteria bacterium]|nr:fluoride efflux transporter CrcB [Gammaproteobacteria bacterium]
MKILAQLVWVATGGAVGAMARYGVSALMVNLGRTQFPWATLLVNIGGSLLAGFLLVALTQAHPEQVGARLFAVVGFLGAFTTFSAFSVDTLLLVQAGDWRAAGFNVVLNVFSSLLACVAGVALARTFVG